MGYTPSAVLLHALPCALRQSETIPERTRSDKSVLRHLYAASGKFLHQTLGAMHTETLDIIHAQGG